MHTLLKFLSNFCRVSDTVRSSWQHFKGSPASWASLFTLLAALKLSHFNHICAYCLTCCCCCCFSCCCRCCFCIWLEAGQRAELRSYLSLWRSVWLIQVWLFHVHTAELLWPACYSWLNTHTPTPTHAHTDTCTPTQATTGIHTLAQHCEPNPNCGANNFLNLRVLKRKRWLTGWQRGRRSGRGQGIGGSRVWARSCGLLRAKLC